jgi:hypothetical protein
MPLFAPSHPGSRSDPRQRLFEPASKYPSETGTRASGQQVTDPNDHETRKRTLFDEASYSTCSTPTPYIPGTDPWGHSLGDSRHLHVRSPPPLANDRYELAGGTEGMENFGKHTDDYDDYFNLEKQRGTWSGATPASQRTQSSTQGAVATPNAMKPWMVHSFMNMVGGVAGKLFQFCAVPFRGFQAGGGKAYTFEANGEVAAKLGLQDDAVETLGSSSGPIRQYLPGNFPEDNYGVLSVDSVDESERPGVSKRQRTGDGWVMVDNNGATISRPSTPRLSERRVPSHTRSPSQIPRPVSRAAPNTPGVKRPSLIPISRRSTLDRRGSMGGSKGPIQPEATPRCYSRQGYNSPVMFETKTDKPKSPLPPESQRLINKMRREAYEDDARLRRMSSQMSDMLREAQEALGSKIEIGDRYMDDEEEEDPYSRQMRLFPR